MSTHLRVLNVEDSERDAALIKLHLERAGYELTFARVATSAAMRAALKRQEWDVVLSDYTVPRFGALAALALLRKTGLDIPFIVISGTVGEEIAVETMLAGANDYLMKGKLTRLAPAIERELQEAANRRARRLAEEALRKSEERFRRFFERGLIGMAISSPTTAILEVNDKICEILGYEREELLQKSWVTMTHPDELGADIAQFERIMAGEIDSYSLDKRWIRKDGEIIHATISVRCLRRADGTVDYFVSLMQDITERIQAEAERARLTAEIENRRRRLNNIVASMPGVVWEKWNESDGGARRVDFVSDYVETMLGYSVEEWLSTPNFGLSIVHPEDRERVARASVANVADGKNSTQEWRWIAKDGSIVWVQTNSAIIRDEKGRPLGVRGVTIDITARKMLEEQLRQSQKMEAVGQLAGGIAHDFNNLLTAINGYSELTMMRLKQEDPLRRNLEEIKKAGDRASALTRQLLAFSRKQVLQPKVLDLNSVISGLENMLKRLIGEDVDLRTMLTPALGHIEADPGQIEQVIMNLALNARDAMPRGGKLTIETQNVLLDDEYVRRHIAVSPGRYVMLAVTDTGKGMDDETQVRIFEPFFTTKEAGKGAGLGLSTVYGIIKQSGGDIRVYSEVDRGTTFKLYLPRVGEGEEEYRQPDTFEEGARGTETILLAEDEAMVRTLAREVLEAYGYRVLEATNGGGALLICEHHREPIHLLITDVVMPEMSGRELADRLGTLRPEMKVLYMSGYTDNAIVHQGVLDEEANFIQKPFAPQGLTQKVREVFDKEARRS